MLFAQWLAGADDRIVARCLPRCLDAGRRGR